MDKGGDWGWNPDPSRSYPLQPNPNLHKSHRLEPFSHAHIKIYCQYIIVE